MGKRLQKKKKKNQKHKQKRQTSNSILEDAKESVSEKSRDFISNLPDEILSNILSCLPFNSAVRTSILSSRWRSLLNNCLADLIVDEARTVLHGTIEEIPSAISGLLRSNSTSWDFFLFMLRPYGWHNFGNMRFLRFHFCQTKILQAITKRDGKLHLDFSKGHNPSSHFDWHLELPFSIIYFHSSEFSFVKTLSIRSVCFLTKDLVSILFTKFMCLQSLSIAECNGLRSLHIDAYCKLESLTVINCPKLNNVHLSSYMLKTLRIRGLLPWFSISYTPYLADAMLDFRGGPAYRPLCRENLLSLLLSLKNVEILTVTGWIFQVTIPRWLPSAGVIFERKDFWFFNLKELWWIDSSMERKQMDALIFFLKLCPYLERLFIHIDPMCYQIPNASTSAIDNNAANSFWIDYTKRVASDVRLNHLKIIKIMGLSNQEDEMLLVDCLLKEVVGVEPMIIAKSQEGRPARLLKKQWWRRCKKSMRIVETKNDYRIIEVENGSDLHPRHAHVSSFV